ncbi:MAG: ATP12 family chaperone protein [Sphingomicrobium sp.]
MKRFWTTAQVAEADGGFAIALDGRRVKTPARVDLIVPTRGLAQAIAREWTDCGETIDPRSMPLTGFANAAVDRVAADPESFAAGLAQYAQGDLLCYHVEGPQLLVDRQESQWNPLLGWARRRFDVDFVITTGIMHVAQPDATVRQLGHAVAALDPFTLAGLSPLVTIGGSLITALAVIEGELPATAAWEAVSIDDAWQAEKWGADVEAVAALALRRNDFLAAARFVSLLGPLD